MKALTLCALLLPSAAPADSPFDGRKGSGRKGSTTFDRQSPAS